MVVRRESAALPGVDALRRLIVIAQGHGDRARSQLIAAFLLSLVDQRRDRFDLHLLATEDPRVRDDCLTVVALAYGGGIAHLLQNEVEIFQHLAKRWGLGRGKQG